MSLMLLCISVSVDAMGIGASFGLRKINIGVFAKFFVGIIVFATTFLAMLLGETLMLIFPPYISKAAGVLVLLLLGLSIIVKAARSYGAETGATCFRGVGFYESLYLGFAVSLDAMGAGIASAALGLSRPELPAVMTFWHLLFLCAGEFSGHRLVNIKWVSSRLWAYISGIILIVLASLRIFL